MLSLQQYKDILTNTTNNLSHVSYHENIEKIQRQKKINKSL